MLSVVDCCACSCFRCAESGGFQGNGRYTSSPHSVADAYMSFVSGHTSISFSCLGFLAMYLFRLCFPARFATRESANRFHANQGYKVKTKHTQGAKTIERISAMCKQGWMGSIHSLYHAVSLFFFFLHSDTSVLHSARFGDVDWPHAHHRLL